MSNNLSSDITSFSASELSAAIKQKQLSCVEVMQAYLGRIHRYNPIYNAIVAMVADDELIKQAEFADSALAAGEYWGWMHGMPHAVKDLADVKGMLTSKGSPLLVNHMAEQDSAFVARIRNQGAIFIGKTNVPEFGMGSQTYNSLYGTTGNAYAPGLTAGGSSGGGACGLATQMLPVADGSDLMGSLRNPGAYNNVIGFRPTQGRVPGDALDDLFYQQLATAGPMGRNAEDTIRLFHTMAGQDVGLPLTLRDRIPGYENFTAASLMKLKIGWLGNYQGRLAMEPGVLELCEASLSDLASQGAVVEDCKIRFDLDELWQTWVTLRHWLNNRLRPFYDEPSQRKQLKPEVKWEIEGSMDLSAEQIYNAGISRAHWFRALTRLFDEFDFLALPTAQVFPFAREIHWPDAIDGKSMDTYHRWMEVVIGGTLAGLPTVNVPVGFDQHGRAMGMQIMGRFGEDQGVLEFAMAYEGVTEHLNQRPVLLEQGDPQNRPQS